MGHLLHGKAVPEGVEHGPEGHVGPVAVFGAQGLHGLFEAYPCKGLAKWGGPQARK